jgi:4'-phosphopantetheinyl transferase
LSPDEVHVYLVRTAEVADPALLATYEALLSEEERRRRDRFAFAEGRLEALISRVLVRTTLSRYHAVPPSSWQFVVGSHGKPEVAPQIVPHPPRFNLSHTMGLIAIAVASHHDVGVDVEWLLRRGETVQIADRYFSTREVAALESLPQDQRRRRFFQYWTLKEAYIKARGLGLSLPLDQFSFELDTQAPIRITFGAGITDQPGDWQFQQSFPTAEHAMALAVRRGGAANLRIDIEQIIPHVT